MKPFQFQFLINGTYTHARDVKDDCSDMLQIRLFKHTIVNMSK